MRFERKVLPILIAVALLLGAVIGTRRSIASGIQALATIFVGTTPVVGGTTGDFLSINSGLLSSTASIPASSLTGLVSAAHGGTGVDSSASTGIAQLAAGSWAFSNTLASGVRGTTQSTGNSSTSLATTAFVANAIAIPFASLTAATGNIANTETVVTSFLETAGLFKAGGMIRVTGQGSCTTGVSAPTFAFRVRIGPTTLMGTAMTIAGPQVTASQTSKHFDLEGYVTIRSIAGTTATVDSESTLITDPTLLVLGPSSFGGSSGNTFDPTLNNLVELTFQSGNANSSCTFFMALLEQII